MRAWLCLALVACTAWCAGNLIVAAAAPKIFAAAPPQGALLASRADAGVLFGGLLRNWTQASAVLLLILSASLAIIAIMLLRRGKQPVAALTLAAMVACVALHWAGTSMIVRAQAARERQATADFAVLHRRSTQIFGLQTLLLAILDVALAVSLARIPHIPLPRE